MNTLYCMFEEPDVPEEILDWMHRFNSAYKLARFLGVSILDISWWQNNPQSIGSTASTLDSIRVARHVAYRDLLLKRWEKEVKDVQASIGVPLDTE